MLVTSAENFILNEQAWSRIDHMAQIKSVYAEQSRKPQSGEVGWNNNFIGHNRPIKSCSLLLFTLDRSGNGMR